jgi:hypothetical protein
MDQNLSLTIAGIGTFPRSMAGGGVDGTHSTSVFDPFALAAKYSSTSHADYRLPKVLSALLRRYNVCGATNHVDHEAGAIPPSWRTS